MGDYAPTRNDTITPMKPNDAFNLTWGNDTFSARFHAPEDRPVQLIELAPRGVGLKEEADLTRGHRIVEVLSPAHGRWPGSDRIGETEIGLRLRFRNAEEVRDSDGAHHLVISQLDGLTGLQVDSHFRAWPGVSGYQSWQVLTATVRPVVLEAVTSAIIPVFPQITEIAADNTDVLWGQASWVTENVWHRQSLREYGLTDNDKVRHNHVPRNKFGLVSPSSWSSGKYLPTGAITTKDNNWSVAFQVEHSGAWSWEVAEDMVGLHASLTGPVESNHQWVQRLEEGQSFTTVPASATFARGDYQQAIGEMTLQRRALRESLRTGPREAVVVFNDYMNTLFGDPTEEKERPLIEAAGKLGVEFYCIDAGWYSNLEGAWWDTVGKWQPSPDRFPSGLGALTDLIRAHGMTPGLWLEPEVIGVNSPMVDLLPDDAFFWRHGVRVREHARYHLDLRSPAARAHLDETVDRLVAEFGIGFFKLDYNITAGSGTTTRDPSTGAGLLGHNRAYFDWVRGLKERHPGLIIENCASGAQRADYHLLSVLDMQSTSDQTDPLKYAAVAAGAPMSILPEQAGNWGYAQPEMSDEHAALTLSAGIMGRLYLSGFINRMDEDRLDLVREAIAVHRDILSQIAGLVPFWPAQVGARSSDTPAGLPGWEDDWVVSGLRSLPDDDAPQFLTVWRRGGPGEVELHFPQWAGRRVEVTQVFPTRMAGWKSEWDAETSVLRLTAATVTEPSARVFRMRAV